MTLVLKVDILDLCFFRTLLNFIVAIFVLLKNKKHPVKDLPKEGRIYLLGRSVIGTVGFIICVFSMKYVPIFIVQIILNTAPFCTMVLGYFINKEIVGFK